MEGICTVDGMQHDINTLSTTIDNRKESIKHSLCLLSALSPHPPAIPRAQSRPRAKLFLQSSELGLPPHPHQQASVPPPPPFGSGGWGGGTLVCGRGGGEVPIPKRGQTLWPYINIYVPVFCNPKTVYKIIYSNATSIFENMLVAARSCSKQD